MNEDLVKRLERYFGTNSAAVPRDMVLEVAHQFVPQLNTLLGHLQPLELSEWNDYTVDNDESEELKLNLLQYGSDKPTHGYHQLYANLFNQLGRDRPFKLLEIGMGSNNPEVPSNMGKTATPGASGFGFRDYLPNAQIYMADVDRDILFSDIRIHSTWVDQMQPHTFEQLDTTFSRVPYDLIIDDGLHNPAANINTLNFALGRLNKNGWIVIEDIRGSLEATWHIVDSIVSRIPGYRTALLKSFGPLVYLVNRTE